MFTAIDLIHVLHGKCVDGVAMSGGIAVSGQDQDRHRARGDEQTGDASHAGDEQHQDDIRHIKEKLRRQRPAQTERTIEQEPVAKKHDINPRLRQCQIMRHDEKQIQLMVIIPLQHSIDGETDQKKTDEQRIETGETRAEKLENCPAQPHGREQPAVIVVDDETAQDEKQRHAVYGEKLAVIENRPCILEIREPATGVRKQDAKRRQESQAMQRPQFVRALADLADAGLFCKLGCARRRRRRIGHRGARAARRAGIRVRHALCRNVIHRVRTFRIGPAGYYRRKHVGSIGMHGTERIDFVAGKMCVTTTSVVIGCMNCAAMRHSLA